MPDLFYRLHRNVIAIFSGRNLLWHASANPKNKIIVFCALLYAFYIGLGVSVTIHWVSEFAAGAIIGSVIGMTVGRSFRIKL